MQFIQTSNISYSYESRTYYICAAVGSMTWGTCRQLAMLLWGRGPAAHVLEETWLDMEGQFLDAEDTSIVEQRYDSEDTDTNEEEGFDINEADFNTLDV
ncbi:hypothetical protein PM082_009567 [Marasmius tenuissimus]|nr:hypothetical protein PM082_009567 [Marasmius tenuissimus]